MRRARMLPFFRELRTTVVVSSPSDRVRYGACNSPFPTFTIRPAEFFFSLRQHASEPRYWRRLNDTSASKSLSSLLFASNSARSARSQIGPLTPCEGSQRREQNVLLFNKLRLHTYAFDFLERASVPAVWPGVATSRSSACSEAARS